jgi:NAD(P)H dehydrogenase (quinone)
LKIFIIYCHPSENSFTYKVLNTFISAIKQAGHTYELSDLYKMDFTTDISEAEYVREAFYRDDLPLADDVKNEQYKVNRSEALVFIYPVFWTEAPAKLVGWFNRVK